MRTTAFAALLVAAAATAQAQPSLQFVANPNSSVTLQIVVDATGSTGSEIGIEIATQGITLTGASIADPLFDTPNPGANPFTGTETTGLWLDGLPDNLFVSYGSDILSPGTYDFLNIDYAGNGVISASGIVAQLGVVGPVLTASINTIPEPTSCALLVGLIGLARLRRRS